MGASSSRILGDTPYSREYLQAFKNGFTHRCGNEDSIRFGGMMKGYIRRAFGDELLTSTWR